MLNLQYTIKVVLLFMAVLCGAWVFAQSSPRSSLASDFIDSSNLVGSAVYTVGFRSFYEISLYRESSLNVREGRRTPYALEISYMRDHAGDDVADRVISQMRVSGYTSEIRLAQWHMQLVKMLPDFSEGSKFVVVLNQARETHFYSDGLHIGQIKDPAFGWRFIGIWLGENTSESRIRDDLTGGSESENPLNEEPNG